MTEDYIPNARTTIGASELPAGREYYEHLVRNIHDPRSLGGRNTPNRPQRSEAHREEMQAVMKETGFRGDFPAFLKFLRTDPRFYAKTAEDLLKHASYIAKRMDGKLPLPIQNPAPPSLRSCPGPRSYSAEVHQRPIRARPKRRHRARLLLVNTYALENRPLYVLESLTFHEAVPAIIYRLR